MSRSTDAPALLDPLLAQFTPGFATLDLDEARALRDSAGHGGAHGKT